MRHIENIEFIERTIGIESLPGESTREIAASGLNIKMHL